MEIAQVFLVLLRQAGDAKIVRGRKIPVKTEASIYSATLKYTSRYLKLRNRATKHYRKHTLNMRLIQGGVLFCLTKLMEL